MRTVHRLIFAGREARGRIPQSWRLVVGDQFGHDSNLNVPATYWFAGGAVTAICAVPMSAIAIITIGAVAVVAMIVEAF